MVIESSHELNLKIIISRHSVIDIFFLISGDSLNYHRNMAFSTKDADHDRHGTLNCAMRIHGAWWYCACRQSDLNGKYYQETETVPNYMGIHWSSWKGMKYSLKAVSMKIRPAGFTPGEQSNILNIYSRLAVSESWYDDYTLTYRHGSE